MEQKSKATSRREKHEGQRTGTDHIGSHSEKKICGGPRFHLMGDVYTWMCSPDVRDRDGTDRFGGGGGRNIEFGGQCDGSDPRLKSHTCIADYQKERNSNNHKAFAIHHVQPPYLLESIAEQEQRQPTHNDKISQYRLDPQAGNKRNIGWIGQVVIVNCYTATLPKDKCICCSDPDDN